jgi:hypothetical protein
MKMTNLALVSKRKNSADFNAQLTRQTIVIAPKAAHDMNT